MSGLVSVARVTRALFAGLVAGVATGFIVLVPVLILQGSRGVGVVPEMQLAASSLVGLPGAGGFLPETALRFLVALVPAVLHALVDVAVPPDRRLPWLTGPLLGLGVFLMMGFVVLPHTAFAVPAGVTPMPLVPALLIHLFGLGLPIALIVQRRLRIA